MIKYFEDEFYRNMAKNLKSTKEKVAFILEHFPETRDNDNLLCSIYWRIIDNVKLVEHIGLATKAESIRRVRQKIQNHEHKYLPINHKNRRKVSSL